MNSRQTIVNVCFSGVDVTQDISQYLVSAEYVDNEAEAADDLRITIADRGREWLDKWLEAIRENASQAHKSTYGGENSYHVTSPSGLAMRTGPGDNFPRAGILTFGSLVRVKEIENGWAKIEMFGKQYYCNSDYVKKGAEGKWKTDLIISAAIIRKDWMRDGETSVLNCGDFELDELEYNTAPNTLTIKATSLPYSTGMREKKNRAFENIKFSDIIKGIAASSGMGHMYLSSVDPVIKRAEQNNKSDASFLSHLGARVGISVKFASGLIIAYTRDGLESEKLELTYGEDDCGFRGRVGRANIQYDSCRVSYVNPKTGKAIVGYAYEEGYDPENENNQQLEITAYCTTQKEAEEIAMLRLRRANRYSKTAEITIPGNPDFVASAEVSFYGYGPFDADYVIESATHTVDSSGYVTSANLRLKTEA